MAHSDFIMVQLSPAGVALAGGEALLVQDGRAHYRFVGDDPVRVLTSELKRWLSTQYTPSGEPIFEIVPATPALVASTEPAASEPATESE